MHRLTPLSALWISAWLAANCANPAQPPSRTPLVDEPAPQPDEAPPPEAPQLTPAQRVEVERAARLGKLLFEHDHVAALASDYLMTRELPLETVSHGWITMRDGDTWRVPFLFRGEAAEATLHTVRFDRVAFDGSGDAPPTLETTPFTASDERTQHMFAALETVRQRTQTLPMCTRHVNHVILPAAELGKSGWLVYVLAATHEAGTVVAGGHHRFLVSPDGRDVLEHFQFTRACVTIPAAVNNGETAATVVTHLTSETPTELHVFLSHLHRAPVLVKVVEPSVLWGVLGARIEQIPLEE